MLASARVSDSGTYSCVAVNAVGEDRRDVVLRVHSESRAPEAAGCGLEAQDGGAGASPVGRCARSVLRPCLPSCRGPWDPPTPTPSHVLNCETPLSWTGGLVGPFFSGNI